MTGVVEEELAYVDGVEREVEELKVENKMWRKQEQRRFEDQLKHAKKKIKFQTREMETL